GQEVVLTTLNRRQRPGRLMLAEKEPLLSQILMRTNLSAGATMARQNRQKPSSEDLVFNWTRMPSKTHGAVICWISATRPIPTHRYIHLFPFPATFLRTTERTRPS